MPRGNFEEAVEEYKERSACDLNWRKCQNTLPIIGKMNQDMFLLPTGRQRTASLENDECLCVREKVGVRVKAKIFSIMTNRL